jgi:phosphoenolpyruvate-protein phosphotransferase (PTS system enzyme I)
MPAEALRLRGHAAAPGLAAGPLIRLRDKPTAARSASSPETERAALLRAMEQAASDLARLLDAQTSEAAAILEFQLALLEDADLTSAAFAEIDAGAPADHAWRHALDAQIAGYASAEDSYFRARSADLVDLRDRVLRALSGDAGVDLRLPAGAILVADDLPPSRFLEIDWRCSVGVALIFGSASSHVAMLARARGVPMVVGLGDIPAVDGTLALLDAERGEIEIAPSAARLAEWRERTAALTARREEEQRHLAGPAITASGRRIHTMINIQGLIDLKSDASAHADGIGLVRTEFLFQQQGALPDEAAQYRVYREILDWAGARPVTIRTLDAGGDKPIPGVTIDGEANPFLGVRGLRLSLRRRGLFKTQLRALARAGSSGHLKVMLPMVTTPAELREARGLLDEVLAELASEGLPARRPALGIMVEVPAAALAIDRFDADFYSIGSNDLVQYLTACDRGNGELVALADPLNPAVLELIERTVAHGRRTGAPVSLCGDMAADPRCVPALLDCGLEELSVAPPALGLLKAAITRHG